MTSSDLESNFKSCHYYSISVILQLCNDVVFTTAVLVYHFLYINICLYYYSYYEHFYIIYLYFIYIDIYLYRHVLKLAPPLLLLCFFV